MPETRFPRALLEILDDNVPVLPKSAAMQNRISNETIFPCGASHSLAMLSLTVHHVCDASIPRRSGLRS
jgi:hypothetical protein